MKKIIMLAVGTALWLSMHRVANAQVAWGPGFVVAPYVRVDWGHGGVHVQAPFVDIHTGGWCCNEAVAKPLPPPVPRQPVAIFSTPAEQLYSAGRELNRALERFDTAATWQRYLGLSSGQPLASVPVEHLAGQYMYPASDVADVAKLRGHFEKVSRDQQYQMIANLPAFQKTYRLLLEFVDQPKQQPERAIEELPVPNELTTLHDDRPRPQD